MGSRHHIVLVFVWLSLCFSAAIGSAQTPSSEKHAEVSMRMIGHELLLNADDSTSRVLPVKKEGDRYQIQFESEFAFHPEVLVATIDSVVNQTNVANSYIVQVENNETGEVVHAYEVGVIQESDVIPCGLRSHPLGSYSVYFTILQADEHIVSSAETSNTRSTLLIIPVLLLIGLGIYFWNKRDKANPDFNIIQLGGYVFDKRNMNLSFNNESIELTSKETDLLSLLHSSANTTVERDVILKNVWGDNGDYIGRTLDVFISKLRKKLEADPSVRIANTRGIGYKLVVNDTP